MQKIIEKYVIFGPKWEPKSTPKSMQKSMRKIIRFLTPFETCLVSEREARYNNQTCRHVSPHAAEWRSLQLLVTACRILSTLRALSALRSSHDTKQKLCVSVWTCLHVLRVFARMCVYLHVFARFCVRPIDPPRTLDFTRVHCILSDFARICAYLRVFACICTYVCAYLLHDFRKFARICTYFHGFARI